MRFKILFQCFFESIIKAKRFKKVHLFEEAKMETVKITNFEFYYSYPISISYRKIPSNSEYLIKGYRKTSFIVGGIISMKDIYFYWSFLFAAGFRHLFLEKHEKVF